MRSNTVAVGFGVLGIVLIILAVLYALGILQITFTASTSGPHYKHAILCVVLAVASFVAANFARVRTV